jgi:hypothetical protein
MEYENYLVKKNITKPAYGDIFKRLPPWEPQKMREFTYAYQE